MKTNLLKMFGVLALGFGIFYFFKGSSFSGQYFITDISSELQTHESADFTGAISVNLDGDNEEEILITAQGSDNLFLDVKSKKFLPLLIPELRGTQDNTVAVVACDLDRDGRDEILFLNKPSHTLSAHHKLMKFSTSGWSDLLSDSSPLQKTLHQAISGTCIDRKGDGHYGLVVVQNPGKIAYLELIDGKLVNQASLIGMDLEGKSSSVIGIPGASGFTNLFVGTQERNFYFINQGDGTFIESAEKSGLLDATFDTRGASTADLNRDELADLVYCNHVGPTRLLVQKRDGSFSSVASEELNQSYACNAVVVADLNLDGHEDIYLNNIKGANALFAGSKSGFLQIDPGPMTEKDLSGIATIVGDLDGNGTYEVFNTHGDGKKSKNTFYRITPVHQSSEMRVRFSNGGIPRGAVLILKTTKRQLLRVIQTGSGRYANYHPDMIFGLFPDEVVIGQEVILPSGQKQVFKYRTESGQRQDITLL